MSGATILESVSATGRDRFGAGPTTLRLRPAGPGTGIVFNRSIRSCLSAACVHKHATGLSRGRQSVRMVEHLLATCYALGVTDLAVETSNAELPLFDGSALPYVRLLHKAGVVRYEAGPEPARLKQPVRVRDRERFIAAVPAQALRISCLVCLPGLGPQFHSVCITPESFGPDLAGARTFVRTRAGAAAVQRRTGLRFALKRIGGLVYPARRRYPDEPCRHKILDIMGDLALLGRPVTAELFAFMPGHTLNLKLAAAIERQLEER